MSERQSAHRRGDPMAAHFGVSYESTLALRERLADMADLDFGHERIFPELVDALLAEVPEGTSVLEIGAATGLLTRPLLEKAGHLTAVEPSAGMLRRLLTTDVASSPRLSLVQGLAEDLPADSLFDVAVVTFTPRRGMGLFRLLLELATRVADRVVMLLETEKSLDWAYLTRAASMQGFDVRLHVVASAPVEGEERKHAAVFVAGVEGWVPAGSPRESWAVTDARRMSVPFPAPRGTATRLVRYLLSGGDRAIFIRTDPRGVERLYGNLRTAAHRLGREEITVRRQGELVQLMRIPRTEDEAQPLE